MKGVYKRCEPEEMKRRLAILRDLQKQPLEKKIEVANKTIARGLERGSGCVLFSGGKDSTVLLDLVRTIEPQIEVMHNATYMEPQEIWRYIRKFTKGMKYWETLSVEPTAMWQDTGYYPLLGKRSFTAYKKRIPDLQVSPVQCCYRLKEKQANMVLKEREIQVAYWGNRAGESQRRTMGMLDNGFLFKPKKYPWWQCYPIAHFTEGDIWQYLEKEKIKIPETILLEAGCEACGTDITRYPNNLSRLFLKDPGKWRHYMKSGMAEQILLIKGIDRDAEDVIKSEPKLLLKI